MIYCAASPVEPRGGRAPFQKLSSCIVPGARAGHTLLLHHTSAQSRTSGRSRELRTSTCGGREELRVACGTLCTSDRKFCNWRISPPNGEIMATCKRRSGMASAHMHTIPAWERGQRLHTHQHDTTRPSNGSSLRIAACATGSRHMTAYATSATKETVVIRLDGIRVCMWTLVLRDAWDRHGRLTHFNRLLQLRTARRTG